MMNYKVLWHNNHYNVVENNTDLVLKRTKNKNVAIDFCDFLNRGGGFDGWTPEFILN